MKSVKRVAVLAVSFDDDMVKIRFADETGVEGFFGKQMTKEVAELIQPGDIAVVGYSKDLSLRTESDIEVVHIHASEGKVVEINLKQQ